MSRISRSSVGRNPSLIGTFLSGCGRAKRPKTNAFTGNRRARQQQFREIFRRDPLSFRSRVRDYRPATPCRPKRLFRTRSRCVSYVPERFLYADADKVIRFGNSRRWFRSGTSSTNSI